MLVESFEVAIREVRFQEDQDVYHKVRPILRLFRINLNVGF